MEIWKDIKDYEGWYQISNLGRIKSLERSITHSCGKIQTSKAKIRQPQLVKRGKGYLGIMLYRNSKYTHHMIHRLVAIHFIPNPDNKPEVNHINGNTKDNKVENLEWVTHKENLDHMVESGLMKVAQPVLAIYPDGKEKSYSSLVRASKDTGVSVATIINILNGNTTKPRKGIVFKYIEKV